MIVLAPLVEPVERRLNNPACDGQELGLENNLLDTPTVPYGSFNDLPAFPIAAQGTNGYSSLLPQKHCEILRLGTAELSYQEWRILLYITTALDNVVYHAYIRQQAINALAVEQGLVNTLQAANLATDPVDLNLISLDGIKAEYWVCRPGHGS